MVATFSWSSLITIEWDSMAPCDKDGFIFVVKAVIFSNPRLQARM